MIIIIIKPTALPIFTYNYLHSYVIREVYENEYMIHFELKKILTTYSLHSQCFVLPLISNFN